MFKPMLMHAPKANSGFALSIQVKNKSVVSLWLFFTLIRPRVMRAPLAAGRLEWLKNLLKDLKRINVSLVYHSQWRVFDESCPFSFGKGCHWLLVVPDDSITKTNIRCSYFTHAFQELKGRKKLEFLKRKLLIWFPTSSLR